MSRIYQAGAEILETTLYAYGMTLERASDDNRDQAIALLCQHLNVRIVCTNATKSGKFELVLRADD